MFVGTSYALGLNVVDKDQTSQQHCRKQHHRIFFANVCPFKCLSCEIETTVKVLLRECLSNPEFYDDLIYKFKKLIGMIFLFNLEKKYTLLTSRI